MRSLAFRREIFIKHHSELFAVVPPMSGGGIILQTRDPVAVKLVDHGVNSEPFQPAIPERSRIAERCPGAAFREPGVFAQKFLQPRHAREITLQFGHRRPADVQKSSAVIVQFQRQVRPQAGYDPCHTSAT